MSALQQIIAAHLARRSQCPVEHANEGDQPVAAFIAHAFCADWSRQGDDQAPTLGEARAFVADHEAARGGAFAAAERRLVGAAFAYSVAYTTRCGHAFGKREIRRRSAGVYDLVGRV